MHIDQLQCEICGGNLIIVRDNGEEVFEIQAGYPSLIRKGTMRIQIRCSNFETHEVWKQKEVEPWRQQIIDTYF